MAKLKSSRQKKRVQAGVLPSSIVASYIVGVEYQLKSLRIRKSVLSKLVSGTPVTVRREPKNRADANACAVYFKDRKVGCLPRRHAAELAPRMDGKERFQFYCFDHTLHILGLEGVPTLGLIGLPKSGK